MLVKVPSFLKNKYFLAFIIVLVWLLFFDTHSYVRQWRMQKQLKELRTQREYYKDEILRDSIAIEKLTTDPDALERYARENYLMKRQGEDVFIIIEE